MGGVADAVSDFFSDATDWVGDAIEDVVEFVDEKVIDETFDWTSRFVRDPIGAIGEGVLMGPKWIGDSFEHLGGDLGIRELRYGGEFLGDVGRDPRAQGLAGAVAAAYAAPYVAGGLSSAIGAAAPAPMYSTPALMEAQLAGTVAGPGMMSAAASNLAGMAQASLADMAAADPLMKAWEQLLKGGVKLGVQEGIKEFVIEPKMEEYMEKMKELQALMGQAPAQLKSYGPTSNKFDVAQALAGGSGMLAMPAGTVTGLPDVGPGATLSNMDYLKDIQDYAKLPDLWNYLEQGG